MFFFSNFFLSHVHHRKDSTAKLNSVIVNCSFRLGTVTGVYHLMLCKCFRAMSQTGLFTALMQAEVLLVFCSPSHVGSLSKKKRWLCFLSHVFVLCASCRSNYSTTCERIEGHWRKGCRLSPSSITMITQWILRLSCVETSKTVLTFSVSMVLLRVGTLPHNLDHHPAYGRADDRCCIMPPLRTSATCSRATHRKWIFLCYYSHFSKKENTGVCACWVILTARTCWACHFHAGHCDVLVNAQVSLERPQRRQSILVRTKPSSFRITH